MQAQNLTVILFGRKRPREKFKKFQRLHSEIFVVLEETYLVVESSKFRFQDWFPERRFKGNRVDFVFLRAKRIQNLT